MPPSDLPDWIQRHRWAVGNRLRNLRKEREYSQVQLAERAGIDHKTISRAENGHHAIDIDQIARLARALGVPSADLMPSVIPDGVPSGRSDD